MKKPDLLNMESKEYEKALDTLLHKYGTVKAWLLVFIFLAIIMSMNLLNQNEKADVLKGKIKQDSISLVSYKILLTSNK